MLPLEIDDFWLFHVGWDPVGSGGLKIFETCQPVIDFDNEATSENPRKIILIY